jgi:hypothetical protein
MQIREIEDSRDRELENIVGNLMIAQYQVDKLRSKLTGRIGGYYHLNNLKTSAFALKVNKKRYKIAIRVDEKDVDDEIEIISD